VTDTDALLVFSCGMIGLGASDQNTRARFRADFEREQDDANMCEIELNGHALMAAERLRPDLIAKDMGRMGTQSFSQNRKRKRSVSQGHKNIARGIQDIRLRRSKTTGNPKCFASADKLWYLLTSLYGSGHNWRAQITHSTLTAEHHFPPHNSCSGPFVPYTGSNSGIGTRAIFSSACGRSFFWP
jgi:hypothetical protein